MKIRSYKTWFKKLFLVSILMAPFSITESSGVMEKVYHPYVIPLEKEIEWGFNFIDDPKKTKHLNQMHTIGMGYSLNESNYIEFNVGGIKYPNLNIDFNNYEIEFKHQLTEQGEYSSDWGLLVELERNTEQKKWEIATTTINEKEFGKYSLTNNFSIIYENSPLKTEFETYFGSQLRYRYKEYLEPGIELHMGEGIRGIGPLFRGIYRLNKSKLKWEIAFIHGFSSKGDDQTIKAQIEWEFY
ncbi:MAG: hypothetical protein HN573_03030 [Candidatus Marinimicrobia bacterium]|jgi:hypothetical protein|nr:hypothetical protein [Candidatus Neomarinimicrobiota bacterium]